ncbi:MAG: hypothetical protein GX131_20435 [candidate division WS1 bacterium]|jgi:hypothetical protein|nr:hypothetical protein [candidate division WS1 bacterium]
MASQAKKAFSYALASAVPFRELDAVGIGVIFKASDRSTVKALNIALEETTPLAAAYEAVMMVLDEALSTGTRGIAIYVDLPEVVAQLNGEADVPREVLGKHLQARGMINQVGRVRLMVADSPNFSARLLAESANSQHAPPAGSQQRQLSLIQQNVPAWETL